MASQTDRAVGICYTQEGGVLGMWIVATGAFDEWLILAVFTICTERTDPGVQDHVGLLTSGPTGIYPPRAMTTNDGIGWRIEIPIAARTRGRIGRRGATGTDATTAILNAHRVIIGQVGTQHRNKFACIDHCP